MVGESEDDGLLELVGADVGFGAELAGGVQADRANTDRVATDKTATADRFLLGWGWPMDELLEDTSWRKGADAETRTAPSMRRQRHDGSSTDGGAEGNDPHTWGAMNAYDKQLQAAIGHLADTNPMFDFTAADDDARYRQLKTWWGKPLAEDLRHGHDTSGPITATGTLTNRQSVLLSYLQRPLRAQRSGNWTVTAEPEGDSLRLTLSGYGFTVSALIQETGGNVTTAGISADSDVADPTWPTRMLFRNTFLESPAGDLLDALALGAAFSQSPFARLANEIRRTGVESIDALNIEVDLDWATTAALPFGDFAVIATAAGLDENQVEKELSSVLRRAVELGHAVPAVRMIATAPPLPAAVSAGGGSVLPEGHPARSVLDSLGIDMSGTQVIGVGPGSGYSIGVGMDAGGNLSIADLPAPGASAVPASPEEEFAASVADMLGISREELSKILDED